MLTDEEQDDGFYYKYNESSFPDRFKDTNGILKNGVSGSIMKPNEARRKLDLPRWRGGDNVTCKW